MKLTLSIFALTAAVFLTGCETTVVDRRPVHRSGYYGGHRHDHDDHRHHDRDRDHHRRSDSRRSHYDNRGHDRRDVVIVRDARDSRVSGRAGVEVSTSRGPTPHHRPGSWSRHE